MKEILLNVSSKEKRAAFLKNGQLFDLTIERKKDRQITGNIYKGRVKNILQNIQSAFIDIGECENGFIHIFDIMENTKKFQDLYEMDFELDEKLSDSDSSPPSDIKIEQLLKTEQPVLVQVIKEPIGTKGPRLTSNLSIPGRYLVLLPNTPHFGVSRKIEDHRSRERLKKILRAFEMPKETGLICRTASARASLDSLIEEANELFRIWQEIVNNFQKSKEPCLLYAESDFLRRSLLTAIDKGYDRILIDDYHTYQTCQHLYEPYSKEHPLKIEFYRDKVPMFERFNVEREIEKSLKRKSWLSSGGYLFFDRTEAMFTIDVNSGRSTSYETNVEESLVRINLEAAEEIARQLRIRNIGGLIICDFIDMRYRKNQKRVLEKLKESMKADSVKCTILGMSEFGLVEMTRQRSRNSLIQEIFTDCPYCDGSGLIKNHETISIEIEKALKKAILQHQQYAIRIVTHPEMDHYLEIHDKDFLKAFADKKHVHLEFKTDENQHLNDFKFISTTTNLPIELG